MKLSHWLFGAFAAVSKVSAAEDVVDELPQEPVAQFDLKNYELSYFIEEHPELTPSEAADLLHGESITLQYKISNEEESVITVVGLGGSFRDPLTGEPNVNLTSNSVEPLIIQPSTSATVRQKINLDFFPGDYVLAPEVYVAFNDELKGLSARGQLITVTEPPVSIFNPQFLFLEIIFFGVIGAAVYYFYGSSLDKYLKGTAPVTKTGKSSASASGTQSTWVPKNYHPVDKKPRARKAY
ncbi:hypothetical protein OXX69_004061 [Metschnikowia pulcherrima]